MASKKVRRTRGNVPWRGGAAVAGPVGPPGAWDLMFSDEFDGSSIDTTKWNTNEGKSQNGVTNHTSNISVAGGICTLSLVSSSSGAMLSSGPVDAVGSTYYQTPVGGYVESMVWFPGSGGGAINNWPAWWTVCPSNWPTGGENDIAEGLGGGMTVNYHSPSLGHGVTIPGIWSNSWHVYGSHRKVSSVDIYYDGVLVDTFATSDTGVPHSLVYNNGNGFGTPVYSGAGSQVLIDWCRAWEPGTGTPPPPGGGIARQGTATLYENAAATTAVVPVPAGVVAGEVLVTVVAGSRVAQSDTLTGPAGWTQIIVQPDSAVATIGDVIGLWYRVATGSEAGSYTWTNSAATAGRIGGSMYRFSGVDTTTVLDVAASGAGLSSTSGTTIDAPSITTVTDGAMLVSAGVAMTAGGSVSQPGSMLLIGTTTGTGRRFTWATEVDPTAGATGVRTWTASGDSLQRAAVLAALRPA